jgi:hypothetical protein
MNVVLTLKSNIVLMFLSITFYALETGQGSLTMGYFDNLDNEFSNKYEKILKIKNFEDMLYL